MRSFGWGVSAVVLVAVLAVCIIPACAVLQETTVDGTVMAVDADTFVITIAVDGRWNGASWTTYSVITPENAAINGEAPAGTIFDYITVGDPVQATFTGEEGDTVTWVTISRLHVPSTGRNYISDSWGDPAYIVSPFFNDFGMSYETKADCSECSGSICTASMTSVRVTQGWDKKSYVQSATMVPGETLVFTSPSGCLSEFKLTFVSGQASSSACGGSGGSEGPQPISNFEVHIVTKGTETESTETPVTSVATTDVTSPPGTESSPGFSVIMVLSGLALVLIAAFIRR